MGRKVGGHGLEGVSDRSVMKEAGTFRRKLGEANTERFLWEVRGFGDREVSRR